jgi:methyltransferase of FxLD system
MTRTGAYVAPITKADAHGAHLSSVSAPWLQAAMIRQAGIALGMRVLEIGSGGYNAALLAEIAGNDGLVVSMDIDPDITARASAALAAAGYGERVEVVTADGEHGVSDHAPYDAIVVTVGAWDIPPAWLSQLAGDGTLVLPLRMNTITRSIAFRRAGDHLVSTSAEMCGFVPMQGAGARAERTFRLPYPRGGHVELRFDHEAPSDRSLLDGALAAGHVTAWSGVRIGHAVSFADLHLWLAGFLPGFCRVGGGPRRPQRRLARAGSRTAASMATRSRTRRAVSWINPATRSSSSAPAPTGRMRRTRPKHSWSRSKRGMPAIAMSRVTRSPSGQQERSLPLSLMAPPSFPRSTASSPFPGQPAQPVTRTRRTNHDTSVFPHRPGARVRVRRSY